MVTTAQELSPPFLCQSLDDCNVFFLFSFFVLTWVFLLLIDLIRGLRWQECQLCRDLGRERRAAEQAAKLAERQPHATHDEKRLKKPGPGTQNKSPL